MDKRIERILRSLADPKNAASDDQGCYCSYCEAERLIRFDGEKLEHDADCIVLDARRLVEEIDKGAI